MSMQAEVLQNPPSSNWLYLAGNWPSHPVHTDPVIRKIMADADTRETLLPFLNWAWKRGFLQMTGSEHVLYKTVTEVEAMNWLEIVNKTDNDLGLIIIGIYQQSMWPSLVQLVVRLLELQFLPGSVMELPEYSREIAMTWFMRKLAADVALQQAFMNSACFPGILSFIDWAGIRGCLKEKKWQGQGRIRAMSEEEAEAKYSLCLRVETPQELWRQAITWQCDYTDSSLEWILRYSQYSWGIFVFIAWCLEQGFLEEREDVQ